MNNIESRIEKLESRVESSKRERVTLIVVTGELVCDGMDIETRRVAIEAHKEAAEAKVREAIAEYIAAHPECSEKDIDIISVIDEKTKQLTEQLLRGEGTE